MTTAAVSASVAFTLGVWLTVAVMVLAARRRPAATCVLAGVPREATESMARVLAAEIRPRSPGRGRASSNTEGLRSSP